MSKKGSNNYTGINAQSWAALSLFLQSLARENFSYIELEGAKCEDFDLVFTNENRIICESKDWGKTFTLGHLKEILKKIHKRGTFNVDDQIVIICRTGQKKLKDWLEQGEYRREDLEKKVIKAGIKKELIPLFFKTKIWEVSKEKNEDIVNQLFGEVLNFWIPKGRFIEFRNSILLEKIYFKSAKGEKLTKVEFFSEVDSLRKRLFKESDYLNEKKKMQEWFEKLEKDIKSKTLSSWGESSIAALSSRVDLLRFAFEKIRNESKVNLKKWNPLWRINNFHWSSFWLFEIFENNLMSKSNRDYVTNFLVERSKTHDRFFRDDFFESNTLKIVEKLSQFKDVKKENLLTILRNLLNRKEVCSFYVEKRQDIWHLEQVSNLLETLYKSLKPANKKEIYNFILGKFNLVDDDGDFDQHTPRIIFKILKDWVKDNFDKEFLNLKDALSEQYSNKYQEINRKLEFKGWEHMGGTMVSWGAECHVTDRHFVESLLSPVLNELYRQKPNKTWAFIVKNCISETGKVSKSRPDFLNRASIEVVLNRYKNLEGKDSTDAFNILKEFVLSRKGIPHKADIIYQLLLSDGAIEDFKKWSLTALTLEKYDLPVSPFVERIVSEFASKGKQDAIEQMLKWLKNPKYFNRFFVSIEKRIGEQIQNNPELAFELFENLLGNEAFTSDTFDSFDVYDASKLIPKFLNKDYERTIRMLNKLASKNALTRNEQIILTHGLFNQHDGDKSDNPDQLEKIYNDLIVPLLENLKNDIKSISRKIDFKVSREDLVQFANRLAIHKKIPKALRITSVFIDDPDPLLPKDDREGIKYNEHQRILNGEEPHTISTVRGWCAWTLMNCSVLEGRPYFETIINLIERLTQDPNLYITHMCCFPLSQACKNRLAKMPDKEELFLNPDLEKALLSSKKIESMVIGLLEKLSKESSNVQKAIVDGIAGVCGNIKAINQSESQRVLSLINALSDEVVEKFAHLLIFFAEFRKNGFEDWRWSVKGLYDDLSSEEFDDSPFKKKLVDILTSKDPSHLSRFASAFEYMLREAKRDTDQGKKEVKVAKYYLKILSERFNHNIFHFLYMIIKDEMQRREDFQFWYELYIDCLKKEDAFYKENFKPDGNEMYWWPSMYNRDILRLTLEQGGKEKFIRASAILFSFPKEMELYETDELIENFLRYKRDKRIKVIVNKLFEKNGPKYFKLKKAIDS